PVRLPESPFRPGPVPAQLPKAVPSLPVEPFAGQAVDEFALLLPEFPTPHHGQQLVLPDVVAETDRATHGGGRAGRIVGGSGRVRDRYDPARKGRVDTG